MASPSDDGVVSTDPASVDLWVGTNLGVLKGQCHSTGQVVYLMQHLVTIPYLFDIGKRSLQLQYK